MGGRTLPLLKKNQVENVGFCWFVHGQKKLRYTEIMLILLSRHFTTIIYISFFVAYLKKKKTRRNKVYIGSFPKFGGYGALIHHQAARRSRAGSKKRL